MPRRRKAAAERVLPVGALLGAREAESLAAAVRDALDGCEAVVLELEGAATVHGAALQVLVAAARHARGAGRSLALGGVSPEISSLLRLTGTEAEFRIADAAQERAA